MHHAHIDKFAYQDSLIHRMDPRVKLVAALAFTLVVVSLDRVDLWTAFCYSTGPLAVLLLGGIPLTFALRHVLLVSPFVLVLALTCPFYDTAPMIVPLGPFLWHTTSGWMRCFTILMKFTDSMLALIALISTTRFNDLLWVLQRWHVPEVLVIQLGFLYRYIFVLIDKAHHILRARQGRTLRRLGFQQEMGTISAMLGSLLIQSLDTAGRVSQAMQARGFAGRWHSMKVFRATRSDLVFVVIAIVFLVGVRMGSW